MVTVARPNKDAIVRALDIYRDAMRPFIVRHLGSRRDSSIPDGLRHRMFEAARWNVWPNGDRTRASRPSVFASYPQARAKDRTFLGWTISALKPASSSWLLSCRSYPPVGSHTATETPCPFSHYTKAAMPRVELSKRCAGSSPAHTSWLTLPTSIPATTTI